jgi:uncharacterized protein (DUF488 family)
MSTAREGPAFIAARSYRLGSESGEMESPRPLILTVGHSTHEWNAFLRLLRAAGVAALVDVRRHPGSRRLPQFNSEALERGLREAGIDYLWLGEELGGRRRARAGSANAGWQVAGFRGYADHMASAEFEAGLATLEELARARRTAFMCAEGDWRRCHRRLIADALAARGWDVMHLRRDGRRERHELPPFARVEESRVSYPSAQPTLGT